MLTTTHHPARPDYGIDAPGVVRNLLLIGIACIAVWAAAQVGLWPGRIDMLVSGTPVSIEFKSAGLFLGADCLAIAAWMLWDSLHGKVLVRERLMDRLHWTGSERVLDVGCGRGLMLVGAAKRLVTGKATGIDLWQAEDLSGNGPDATLENARREGVADRVEILTCDMRDMPFRDATFDVIVSRAAIHNLYSPKERAAAVREIARVLADGGSVLIRDIRHGHEYLRELAAAGCTSIERLDSPWISFVATVMTFGSLQPITLLARKTTAP